MINFHYKAKLEKKLMTTFPKKFKKPYFWSIFRTNILFSKKPALCHAQHHLDP